MDHRLARIVESLQGSDGRRRNPMASPSLALQEAIVESGLKNDFDEDDLLAAAKRMGLDDDDAAAFLEEFASWL